MPKRTRTLGNYKRASYKRPAKRARRAARRPSVRASKLSLNVHRFCRYAPSVTVVQAAAGVELDFATSFQFADIVNPGEFSNLFDRYRIDKIVYKIQLLNNPDSSSIINNASVNVQNFYPKLWYIKDYDDASAENITTLQQRANVKMCVMKPNMIKSITVRPAILAQTYRTAVTTGYAPKFGQYIDMGYTDVPHYGLKLAADFEGLSTAFFWSFRVDKQYFFTCKDVR